MDACLSPSELERLAKGELRGAAKSRADGHLQRCAACRSRLEAHRPSVPASAPVPREARRAPEPQELPSFLHGPDDETRDTQARPRARAAHAAPDDAGIEGFRLLEEIHRGGQGVVWRALDEERGEIVALKILREGPLATVDQRIRFDREIELARSLDHPLIVAPLQTGVSRGRPYHVMRFVEGLTLDAWRRETQPSLARMLEAFRDACDAVAHAHARGVVHRDLKPSNILVDARGKPHVVDFGVAKSSLPGGSLPLTVTGEFVGTLSHASPEQAQGDPRLVDERTDVYALGLILYELLTGRMPYAVTGAPADVLRNVLHAEPKNPTSIDPSIDQQLSAIVLRALAKEPARRYPSVARLRDDVDAFLAGMPISARPEGAWDLLARTARRNRRWFVVAAAFAAVLAAVAVLASVQAARFAVQRDRAEAAEEEARKRAVELEAAGAVARRSSHAANVAAASLAIQAGRLGEARRRLEQSPPELRGWEWAHLALAAGASESHVPADGHATIQLGRLADGRAWRATRGRLDVLDAATLETAATRAMPELPRPDEAAAAEILAVAPDGALVALRWDDASWARLGAPGRSIFVADFEGRIPAILEGAAWRPDRAAFSADARRLAATTSQDYDASPRGWSTLTGETLRYPSAGGGGPEGASPVAWSPDGALLVEAGRDGRVRAWLAADASPAWEAEALAGRLSAIAWSGNGARLGVGGASGGVAILDATGAPVLRIEDGRRERIGAIALDHAGARVAAGDDDGHVGAWGVPDGRSLLSLRGHETAVTALAFAGLDETLLSSARDGSLGRWRADEASGPAPLLTLPGARSVAFSPDGNFVAAGADDGTLRVFDVAAGRVHAESLLAGAVAAIAFVPDGSAVLSAAASGEIALRPMSALDSATILGRVPEPADVGAFEGALVAVGAPGVLAAWSPDGTPIWSGEIPQDPRRIVGFGATGEGAIEADVAWGDGRWTRWDPRRSGDRFEHGLLEPVAGARGVVDAVLGEPVAQAFVADGVIRVLSELMRVDVPLDATALAWSPDRRRLFAGDARGLLSVIAVEAHPIVLRLEDAAEVLLTLSAHEGPVTAIAVSPDGRLVAVAGPAGIRLLRSR